MKTIIIILLLFALAGSGSELLAKTRPEKTSSARAAYGYSNTKAKVRMKNKQKVNWAVHHKPAKGTTKRDRANAWIPKRNYYLKGQDFPLPKINASSIR